MLMPAAALRLSVRALAARVCGFKGTMMGPKQKEKLGRRSLYNAWSLRSYTHCEKERKSSSQRVRIKSFAFLTLFFGGGYGRVSPENV